MNPTDVDWSKFGPLLRARRFEFSLSQADLARELGISQPSVSFTERGTPVGLTEDRLDLLLQILRIPASDIPILTPVKSSPDKTKLFLSYSHRDGDVLNRLLVHLRPLAKLNLIDDWSDRRIIAGQDWKNEIETALNQAAIAILLISADFLASDYIVENELPPLLDGAKTKGTVILPIIVKPCRFTRDPVLSRFQALNAPDDPLSGMDEHEKEMVYDSAALQVERQLPRKP